MRDHLLYIVRGLPGAGKTTLAHLLSEHVAEMDDARHARGAENGYWLGEQFKADARLCYVQVQRWMDKGLTPIAVANVFARSQQIAEYELLATTKGYSVLVLHVEAGLSDDQLAARSRTGCPRFAIGKFRALWQSW